MLEAVIENYDLPKTDEYRLKVGSMLVSLRKASAVGLTEMEGSLKGETWQTVLDIASGRLWVTIRYID